MKQSIELGSTPADEDCAQLGTSDYALRAHAECRAYRNQLERSYKNHFNVPELPSGLRLKIGSHSHDFGVYYEIEASFNDDDEQATEAAFWFENNSPTTWDDEARLELSTTPAELSTTPA